MDDGIPRVRVYDLQSRFHIRAWICRHVTAPSIHPILGTMDGDDVGNLPACDQMETCTHWYPPIDCEHIVDNSVHHHMEAVMDELKWELLTEVQGRLEADLLKSYFEAYGIEIELFQESIGHHIYPVTVNGLGRVQLFVSKEQTEGAHQLLDEYNTARE
jgi:hypothetical protein